MSSRIEKLMSQMTLAEKLGQLTMTASSYAVTGPVIAGDSTESIKDGTIGNLLNMVGPGPTSEMQKLAIEHTRLGIPLLIGLDIIHGHKTLFPIPLAEAALFDEAAWELTAREAAIEGAADGLAMTFAPMLDVSRDLRWGRTAEGSGEDGWLATRMARAKVRGYQGSDLSKADAIAACAKHFVAYAPVQAGREYASVDISERTLHEVHLPPFEAAVKAGVATIMPAFTDLAGIPMTAHKALLKDYLRDQLGFDGVLVSDYNAIGELIRHGVAADLADAAALALKAGVDIDMMADAYRKGLPVALERGTVTMDDIDVCVRRVLKLKEDLGLFDDPYRRGATPQSDPAFAERRRLARRIGAQAITMMKNEQATLPLSPQIKRLSVIGPLADAGPEMRGCWWGAGEHEPHVGVLEGIRKGFPDTEIRHAAGTAINSADRSGIASALKLCNDTDAVLLCIGEATAMSGEAASRAYPELPGSQLALAEAVFEYAHERGVPVIVVLFSGRPLVIPQLAEKADALLACWFLGTEAGNAIADVVKGAVSPGGRTPMSWPRALGQVPLFFGQRNSGRPMNPDDFFTSKYLDVPNTPLYPFGHGLTYGEFEYRHLRLSSASAGEADTITVTVDLQNHGPHAATETVFLFVHDKVATVARPLLELRAFGKITLKPGESGTVALSLAASELRFPGIDLKPVFEPGEVDVLVGPSADRARLLSAILKLT